MTLHIFARLVIMILISTTRFLAAAQELKTEPTINLVSYFNSLNTTLSDKKAARSFVFGLTGTKEALNAIAHQKDFLGETPLIIAANRGWFDVTKILIEWGSDIEATEKVGGETPLIGAIKNFTIMPLGMLSNRACSANKKFLKKNPIHLENYQIRNDIAVSQSITELNNKLQKDFLKLSPKNPYFKIVSLLLIKGAEVNKKDRAGNTALHYAIWFQAPIPVLELLLLHGADINSKNNRGFTPLHYASDHRDITYISFLINNGANINVQDMHGDTLMHLLAFCSNRAGMPKIHVSFLKKIITNFQPDLGIKNVNEQTPYDVVAQMPPCKRITKDLLCVLRPPIEKSRAKSFFKL